MFFKKKPTKPAVLFVCLGNICRSPLAEAAFRQAAEKAGLDVVVDSAGTGGWHVGEAPDPRAQGAAKRHGTDITHLKARQLKPADFLLFTHIIAMDSSNLADIQRMKPARSDTELHLLLDFAEGRTGQSVADPYYSGDAAFDVTWADAWVGAQGLVAHLRTKS